MYITGGWQFVALSGLKKYVSIHLAFTLTHVLVRANYHPSSSLLSADIKNLLAMGDAGISCYDSYDDKQTCFCKPQGCA